MSENRPDRLYVAAARKATKRRLVEVLPSSVTDGTFLGQRRYLCLDSELTMDHTNVVDRLPYDFSKIIEIRKLLDSSSSLLDAYQRLEPLILQYFNADRMSIFQRRANQQDLLAKLKTGGEVAQIAIPLNTKSIAGYVALSQKPVVIESTQDHHFINKIHPSLRFNGDVDKVTGYQTKNMICTPIIHHGVMLGALQIINRSSATHSIGELKFANDIARLIGLKYRAEIICTDGPFDYLIEQGFISREELNHVVNRSENPEELINTLIKSFGIHENDVGNALAVHFQIPYIGYSPQKYYFSDINLKLSHAYMERNQVVIVEEKYGDPIILMAAPNDSAVLLEIETVIPDQRFKIAVGFTWNIQRYQAQRHRRAKRGDIKTIAAELNADTEKVLIDANVELDNEPAIVQFVSRLLEDAFKREASDIHIEPNKDALTKIRYRIDGECVDIQDISYQKHRAIVSRIKIMANLNVAESRLPQDGKLSISLFDNKVEFRVATLPTVDGEALVLRLLASSDVLPMNELSLLPATRKKLQQLITKPYGILLVVGPTGSGKTTTLHSVLHSLNGSNKKIWTAEDPVEITQKGIQQVQVHPAIGLTFARALRSFLRADPDVILIGEMRDKETAQAALEASLTGHLVLSTLHTNTAPATISRLLEMGIEPLNFSDACLGVLAQRLVKTLCSKCKQVRKINDEEYRYLHAVLMNTHEAHRLKEDSTVHIANGCQTCNHTGYKGRMCVNELLVMNEPMRALVRNHASTDDLLKQAIQDGMLTLAQEAAIKVLAGHTDIPQLQLLQGLQCEPLAEHR